jgi:hypothetical protein
MISLSFSCLLLMVTHSPVVLEHLMANFVHLVKLVLSKFNCTIHVFFSFSNIFNFFSNFVIISPLFPLQGLSAASYALLGTYVGRSLFTVQDMSQSAQ